MKTIKGYTIPQILELMLFPLPKEAFKQHPTKNYLTTISADYTRERLTKVFGLFGLGWGLDWQPENADKWTTQTAKGKDRYHFALLQAEFWFNLDGEKISFPVTGYSDNDNLGDAMEGARTSAVSAGAKQLLFQLHIYQGSSPKVISFNGSSPICESCSTPLEDNETTICKSCEKVPF